MKKYKTTEHLINIEGFQHGSLSEELIFYFIENPESNDDPIILELIGVSNPDPDYFISRKKKDRFIFEYVIDGKGYVVNEDKYYTVKKGDVYILEPESTHHYYSDKNDPYKKIWINFRSEYFKELFVKFGISGITHFPNVGCLELFNELTLLEKISIYSHDVTYEATGILFRILMRLVDSVKNNHIAIPEDILNVKRILDNSIYEKVSIEKLCNETSISRSSLIAKFKQHFSTTPHQYLLDRKIQYAISLLKNSNMQVKEIASLLNFSDEFNFSKTFKNRIGVSPKNYSSNLGRVKDKI